MVNKKNTEFISSWDNHVNGWLRSNTETLFVKYEDLLDQTSEHIAKVLDFLKIEPVCSLDEIVNSTSFNALKAQENTVGFKEKAQGVSFFRKGVKNGWQDHDWDFSELEEKFAPVMEKFGY